jgi:hypothetical protein
MLKTVSALIVALGLFAGDVASAQVRVVVRSPAVAVRVRDYRPREAPPEMRVETQGRPRHGYFWVNGQYNWRGGRYMWNRGRWERNRHNREYVPGRWETGDGGAYVYVRPRWDRH